ncbi:hypothetical protein HPB48_003459 [Haemaphysalis longicornis]|uniref:Cytochrome b5 heme-binding domain-containing protein n=1 Tax=Haemaphysalis longicornis TaxID=44386 RepID=A0A9J6GEA8_HAELO|nr:hypothetical protein HPB48_003459 [Haemaphysalis longicornis]
MSWGGLLSEVFLSPLNVVLSSVCVYLIYKIFFSRQHSRSAQVKREPELPPMKKRDMTPEEIRKYDGTGEDGRVLVAVNGKVFDVTRGRNFYGPGGPYHAFAGHDASRGLATFSVERPKDGYDDLSDLNPMEMESVREWEMQFTGKWAGWAPLGVMDTVAVHGSQPSIQCMATVMPVPRCAQQPNSSCTKVSTEHLSLE